MVDLFVEVTQFMSLMDANGTSAAGASSQVVKPKLSARDVDSPKSVILDPRIVSPSSSASGSMERRLPDLRRQPRHDRGYSVSDGDDYDAALRLSGLVTRQMSKGSSSFYGTLESLPETHFLPTAPPRLSTSGVSSENSTPRVKIGRSLSKDIDRCYTRAPDNEFLHRRLSSSGAETSACSLSLPPHSPGPASEDEIELNKFVVSRQCGSGSEEMRAREHKLALANRSTRDQDHRHKSADGKADSVGPSHLKSLKAGGFPDSPAHNGFSEWPRAALIELASELVLKETSKFMKDLSESHFSHRRESFTGSFSPGSNLVPEKMTTAGKVDESRRRREAVSNCTYSLPSPGSPLVKINVPAPEALSGRNSLADFDCPSRGMNVEKSTTHGIRSAMTDRAGLLPQQRVVSGQYMKTKALKAAPSKWDDAEKWIVNSGSPVHAQCRNGLVSSALPQQQSLSSSALAKVQQSAQSLYPCAGSNSELSQSALDTSNKILLSGKVDVSVQLGSTRSSLDEAEVYPPRNSTVSNSSLDNENTGSINRSLDSKRDGGGAHSGKVDTCLNCATVKTELVLVSSSNCNFSESDGDDSAKAVLEDLKDRQLTRVGLGCESPVSLQHAGNGIKDQEQTAANIFDHFTKDKFANSIMVQTQSNGRCITAMKDAATEITPSPSRRDMATQITPVQSFHAIVTPPRLHGAVVRLNTTPVHSERRSASVGVDVSELQSCHLAKLQLDQAAALDPSCNWNTREEEVAESAKSLRLNVDLEEVKRNVLAARATAWEEAEHAKYMARYHREEAKILAWEAHQKAKAEAEMKKIEVKLERMRSHATETLQNRLASVHLRAEDFRAAAAAECGEQAAKTNQSARRIRASGRLPGSKFFSWFSCCFNF